MTLQSFKEQSTLRQSLTLLAGCLTLVTAIGTALVWAADQRYEQKGQAAIQVGTEQYEFRQEILIWKEASPNGLTPEERAEKAIIERRLESLKEK